MKNTDVIMVATTGELGFPERNPHFFVNFNAALVLPPSSSDITPLPAMHDTTPHTRTDITCQMPLMKPSMKSATKPGKFRALMRPAGLTFAVAVAMAFLHQNATAQAPVDLGTADGFSVLAGTGISNTGKTTITGNVGLSPTTGAAITGFPPALVNGTVYTVNSFGPVGSINNAGLLTVAKNDLTTAYNNAAGHPANVTYGPVFNLGGQTLVGGVYKGTSSLGITGTLTLNAAGNSNAVWIFQTGPSSTLITASNSKVVLINGAQACMVFWQVTSSATLGTNSIFAGTVLALTSIQALTGATVNGRLLAQNGAVTLDSNGIVVSICPVIPGASQNTVQNTFANALSGIVLTPNQASVAGALDRVLNDTRQLNALAYLDSLDIRAVPHQLDRISPEQLTSIFTLGFAQFDTEVFSVQQRLADIRAGIPASEAAPIPQRAGKNIVPMDDGKSLLPMGKSDARTRMPTEDQWGFFVTETGEFTSLGDTSNANGYNLKSAGTTVGVDRRLGEHFVLGLTLGYSHTDIDLSDEGRLTADGAKIALYAMYHNGGFYTEGLIGAGFNSYDTRRGALNGIASGSTNGTQLDAYYGLGYDVKLGRLTVTPMASMLFTSVGIDGFDERGSLLPLHIESQHENSLRTRAGVRVACTTEVGAARITPSLSAQWQHEFLDTELLLDSRFANGAGSVFSVHGPKIGRDSALLTAAVNVGWSRYSAYVAYQAELGRTNYESQTVLAGFRVSF